MKTFQKKIVGLTSLFLIMSLVVPDGGWAKTQQTTSTPDQGNVPVRAVTQAAQPRPVTSIPAVTSAFNSSTSSPLSRVIPRSGPSAAPKVTPATVVRPLSPLTPRVPNPNTRSGKAFAVLSSSSTVPAGSIMLPPIGKIAIPAWPTTSPSIVVGPGPPPYDRATYPSAIQYTRSTLFAVYNRINLMAIVTGYTLADINFNLHYCMTATVTYVSGGQDNFLMSSGMRLGMVDAGNFVLALYKDEVGQISNVVFRLREIDYYVDPSGDRYLRTAGQNISSISIPVVTVNQ